MKHFYNFKKSTLRSFTKSSKFSFLFLLLAIASLTTFAQPPNDDPCNAILLIPANTCTYQTFTTAAATGTVGAPAPGCANYLGGDVWFKLVVPCTGSISLDTQTGGILDAGMAIYSGTCNSLTLIECDDDDSPNGAMATITKTGLTAGDTIWVRVWEYGNDSPGTFGICASIPPPPGPGGSCSTAAPFCTSTVYTFPNNTGILPGLGGGGIYGCLGTTPNPVFYYMQVETAGNLNIHIVQTNTSGQLIDVDYACWGPFSSLAASCGGLTAANNISCSYSTAGDETASIPNAQVGEFYILLLTNYSNQVGSITFQQSGGSATTSCAVICDITASNSGPICPGETFNLAATLPAGLPGAVYSWTGPNCFNSNQQNPAGVTPPTTPGTYTYTVTATTPSGSSCSATTVLTVGGLSGSSAAQTIQATCAGVNDGVITAAPPPAGGPFTYTLNLNLTGQVNNGNNPVFPNLAQGNYTVTVANSIGCAQTHNITVTQGPAPTAGVAPTNTTCPSVNDGIITFTPPPTGGPFIYTINPGLPTQVIQNNNPVFLNLAPGSYTAIFTNAAGCSGTVSPASVTINSDPLITTGSSNSPTSCPTVSDGTITVVPPLAGGPFIYTLDPGLPTEVIQNNNPVFTNVASGTHTITFTNAAGCSGNVSPNPNVPPGAAPTASTSSTPTSCPTVNDGTITVTNLPVTGAPFIFTLDAGLPTEVIQNNNPVFTNIAAGSHTISFTTAIGCIGTAPNTAVPPGAAPTAATSTTPTSCPTVNDGTITVINLPATGAPFIFTLDAGLPTEVIQNNNPVFTNVAAGSHTISFTTSIGCSGIAPNAVVPPGAAPTAATSTTPTSCPTVNDGTITVINLPATGAPFIFTLDAGLPTEVIQNNNPVFTNLAAGSHTISFTTSIGCSGTAPNAVVPPGAVIFANPPTVTNPPCANINDGVLTINPAVAGTYTYVLNPGLPNELNNGNNPTFLNLGPGSYTYSFTNTIGCVGTANIILTTHTPLATTVTLTQPLCNGNANGIITLNASGGVAPYQYALSPFTTYQGGTFNNLTTGTYTFRIKDDVGCTKDTTVTLAQPSLLTASAVSADGTCNGNDGQITVTANGGTTPYSYSVDNGVTYQPAPLFVVSGGNYPDIRVKDNNNCIANTSVNVVLIDNMFLYPLNDTTICAEQSVTFQPQLSPQANIFHWYTLPYNATAQATIQDSTIKNAVVTPLDTTFYVLDATWGICHRLDTIKINLLHKPIANAGADTAVCYDRTTAVLHGTATNLSGTVNYLWSDTTHLQTPHDAVTVATPVITETFTLTVTDNYGCNFSIPDEVTVTVQPPVPAFAGNDTIAVLGQPHQLLASGGVDYVWSPGYPLNLSNIANPLATLDHDQEFTVIVTDWAGCVGSDKVFLQVYQGPTYHVPNAFSPNGDGQNETFRVIPPGISYTEWFRIFNRFGELVFETNKWMKGWDGTYKGKKQPVGNYIWILKGVDKFGKVVEMKGTVLLVQ